MICLNSFAECGAEICVLCATAKDAEYPAYTAPAQAAPNAGDRFPSRETQLALLLFSALEFALQEARLHPHYESQK